MTVDLLWRNLKCKWVLKLLKLLKENNKYIENLRDQMDAHYQSFSSRLIRQTIWGLVRGPLVVQVTRSQRWNLCIWVWSVTSRRNSPPKRRPKTCHNSHRQCLKWPRTLRRELRFMRDFLRKRELRLSRRYLSRQTAFQIWGPDLVISTMRSDLWVSTSKKVSFRAESLVQTNKRLSARQITLIWAKITT